MFKRLFLTFTTLVIVVQMLAQSVTLPVDPKLMLQQTTPVNPDVAILDRYSMSPPNYSNGLPQQQIPLLEINENGISYPLSLFYSYSGFRVKEEASSFGLGWGITEGMITRVVKHLPDEHINLLKKFEDFGPDLEEEIKPGYLSSGYYCSSADEYTEYNYTKNRLFYKLYDAQPDLYIYNFAGYSGKFFWINDQAVLLKHNDIRIEGDYQDNALFFTITTPDGVQYRFKPADATHTTPYNIVSPSVCSGSSQIETYIDYGNTTAWRLQEIKNLTTQATVSFSYDTITTFQIKDINQITSLTFSAPKQQNGSYLITNYSKDEIYTKTVNLNYYVSEITSDNYKISVITGTRKDSDQDRIKEILVFDKHDQTNPIKTITFTHGYFGDTSEQKTCYLKLKAVKFEGGGNNLEYKFSYVNESLTVGPNKEGLGIDHWGYFNGASNNTLIPLTGTIISQIQNESNLSQNIIAWANRDPYLYYSSSFALEKVQYPTGGHTKINYESANGRGIRVASLEDYDNIDTVFRYYDYGVNDNFVIPATYNYDEYYTFETCSNVDPGSTRYIVHGSNPQGSVDFFMESDNFYENVTEYIGTPTGAGGRTEYSYMRLYGYGNDVLLTEKRVYIAGSNQILQKEKTSYAIDILKTISIWQIPTLSSIAIPTGPCNDDPNNRPACSPVDSLKGYILGDFSGGTSQVSAIWVRVDTVKITTDNLTSTKVYDYKGIDGISGLPPHTQPIRIDNYLSDGRIKKTNLYYPGETDPDNSNITLGVPQMWDKNNANYKHCISPVVKSKTYINTSLINLEADSFTYNSTTSNLLRTGYERWPTGAASGKMAWSFAYDNKANLTSILKQNDLPQSFIWGYDQRYPIAQVTNGLSKDVFYTSFEDSDGNSATGNSKTGKKSKTDGFSKSLTGLTNGDYTLSYWQKSGGNWNLLSSTITITNGTYSIALTGQVDEVRFYPTSAQLTTFTYEPLIGMTSQCDSRNSITYYEYDDFGRLKRIRDQDKNILKAFEYKYQIQQ